MVGLELFKAVICDGKPIAVVFAIIEFVEIAGKCGCDTGLAHDTG
jgi:hypothetical protein